MACLLLVWIAASSGVAEEGARQQMQGLDEQVQEIKSDVLGIAAELTQLEEKLLYPSHTQVSLFVELAAGDSLRLDSVQVRVDGEPVAHHIYSFKELEALQKGGVQRLYTGNLPTGEHRLEVSAAGKVGGSDYAASESFAFTKAAAPAIVGITLTDSGIRIGDR